MARRKRWHRNAGLAALSSPVSALKGAVGSTFTKDKVTTAGMVVLGNVATVAAAKYITKWTGTSKMGIIGATAIGAIIATALGKIALKGQADKIALGGTVATLTRGLQAIVPSVFGELKGLGEDDLDGWDDDGMGDFVDPRRVLGARVGTAGFGDYGSVPQATSARVLDGMDADEVVAQEIGMQA